MGDAITKTDLRDLKEDLKGHIDTRFDAHTMRFDGIDDRLNRVNGRLDNQGKAIDEMSPRLATVEEQSKNLSREVFKHPVPSTDRRQFGIRESAGGVTLAISAPLVKQLITPRNIAYLLVGSWMASESVKSFKDLIVSFLKH